MSLALSVSHLKKIYPGKPPFTAIEDLSFSLKEGEILGFLGPNGSGKTTTIQMLLGTLAMTSGLVEYFGKDFNFYRSEILQHVSFASTYTSLPWNLTLKQNLDVFGSLYGFSPKESEKKYDPLLHRFGIFSKKKERVSSLSAGQVTRLMLVKAFFVEPKIVLLDEPTASLDPDIAKDICSFLLQQRDEKGVAILFCSHKMDEVMQVCDRTIFLKGGRIIADDVPEKLAKSVSTFRVKLVIAETCFERALELIKKQTFVYTASHRSIEILMEEEQIPFFLHTLSKEQIMYANIKIEEPSLEDFFLRVAKDNL